MKKFLIFNFLLFVVFVKFELRLFASSEIKKSIDIETSKLIFQEDKRLDDQFKLLNYEDQSIISLAMELIKSHKPYATRIDNINKYIDLIDSKIKNDKLTISINQKLNKIKSLIDDLQNDSFFGAQYAFDYFKESQEHYMKGLRIRNDTFQVYEKLKHYKNKQLNFSDIGWSIFLIQVLDNTDILGIQDKYYDNYYYKDYKNNYSNKYKYSSDHYNYYDNKEEIKRLQNFEDREKSFKLQMQVIDYFLKNCPADTAFVTKLSGFKKELEYKKKFESPLDKTIQIFLNFLTFKAGEILEQNIKPKYKEFFLINKAQDEKIWREKNKYIKILSPRYPWEEKDLEIINKTPKKPKEKNILDKSKDELHNHIDKTKKTVANQLTNKAEQVIDDTVNGILNSILGDNKSSTGSAGNILKGILGG